MSVVLLDYKASKTPDGRTIIRGVLDTKTLDDIHVDSYQREKGSIVGIDEWKKSFALGRVNDILLGARGVKIEEREDGTCVIKAKTAVIDGLQRLTTARELLLDGAKDVYLGCALRLGTTQREEMELFALSNFTSVKVSTNVQLRNMAVDNRLIRALVNFSRSEEFVLQGAVCWGQSTNKTEWLSAAQLMKVLGGMHSYHEGVLYQDMPSLVTHLTTLAKNIRINTMVANLGTFFGFMEQAWGISTSVSGERPYAKSSFMRGLAWWMAHNWDFWDGEHLAPTDDHAERLRDLDFSSTTMKHILRSTSQSARQDLADLLSRQVNGNRGEERRLKPRDTMRPKKTRKKVTVA